MKHRLRAPSPALVISLIALFVALGGTSYAAIHLPKNSVGAKQLKKNAVTAPKIKNGAVTKAKINTSGLTVPNATNAVNATNATNLGGKTAAALETTAHQYTLPAESGVSTFEISFPGLPAGLYYASYDLTSLMSTAGQEALCFFTDGTNIFLLDYGAQSVFSSFVSTAGSGIVDTRTHAIDLQCNTSGGTFTVSSTDPTPVVSFVNVDTLSSGAATAAARHAVSSPARDTGR
jgi:hypothetical protein